MQQCLTELYALDIAYDVNDFVITDRVLADLLGGGKRPLDEELLILEQEGEAEISLYLAAELVSRLDANDPTTSLTETNLADFWVACEGVSHFTYFVFRASADRSVSLLEMELQAEVDKFFATALFLKRQGFRPPAGLHHWLFELPRFAEALSPSELERYERANHYAARYCRQLLPKLLDESAAAELRQELRYFYRLPRERKIGHIESRH